MTMLKFEPFRGFDSLSRRMNDFVGEIEKGVRFEIGDFSPRVDISEDDKNIYLHAELPGIAKDDVKVSVTEERMLTLKGEKRRVVTDENINYVRVERNYGNFVRSFSLPENVQFDAVQAKFEHGILEVILPKIEPQLPKEVNVEIK
ncbi:MAG: Hsp20/alpha crystallin family protein [Ignavibacteria bacterium]|nr:Hsp20/alpha crystallin family protein [Ignavibacteria bacterium]